MARLIALDEALVVWIATWHTPALDSLMATASLAGRASMLWLGLGLLFALRHPRLLGLVWQMVLAIVLAYILADGVLKPLVGRDRRFVMAPDTRVLGPSPSTYSFPSGHAASSFAAAWVLSRVPRRRGSVPLWAAATLISVSRLYVGVHYPSDVVAGALVGLAAGGFVSAGTDWRLDPEQRDLSVIPR